MSDHTLLTGFPSFLSQCLVRRLLDTDPSERVVLLCQGRFQVAAQVFVRELPIQDRSRVEILWGDPADMDLGLSGPDYRRLCDSLTAICHLSALCPEPGTAVASPGGRGRGKAAQREAPILAGARHLIDLSCDSPRLRRLCHVSSASVSGTRTGVVLEDELWVGQRFAEPRDEQLLKAEQLVRQAMEGRRLPATVLRPVAIVGDSHSGETDQLVGPYALLQTVLSSPVDVVQQLPVLGWGAAPVHMVPVDFVADATLLLLRDARAEGLTFHLADPCPLPLRAVGEQVARLADRKVLRAPTVPPRLLRAVLRAPGIERLAGAPVTSLEALGLMVFYNCQNTLRLLEGSGLKPPPATAYLDRLVAFLQQAQQALEPLGTEKRTSIR